jgi:hypothetical protein
MLKQASYCADISSMMNDPETKYYAEIKCAYEHTHKKFSELCNKPEYKDYVVPLSTAPQPGFAIFYTPALYRPNLLIVGQNPSDFSNKRDNKADPNGEMLSGTGPPKVNSYTEHKHNFAITLGELFAKDFSLLKSAVGMNVWYFQCTSNASMAPDCLLEFCADTTKHLVKVMEPKAILCFGDHAYKALETVGNARKWHVRHPSARSHPDEAKKRMPSVIKEILAYLDGDGNANTQ